MSRWRDLNLRPPKLSFEERGVGAVTFERGLILYETVTECDIECISVDATACRAEVVLEALDHSAFLLDARSELIGSYGLRCDRLSLYSSVVVPCSL